MGKCCCADDYDGAPCEREATHIVGPPGAEVDRVCAGHIPRVQRPLDVAIPIQEYEDRVKRQEAAKQAAAKAKPGRKAPKKRGKVAARK